MKSLYQRPLLHQVLFTNSIAVVGVLVGIAVSGVKPSFRLSVYCSVFVIAWLNLMFLSAGPRFVALRAAGDTAVTPFGTLYGVLKERPFITALCILQLVSACQATATTFQIVQSAASGDVRSLPNSSAVVLKMGLASVLMAADSALWFLSAVGLWRTRSWAWWMALVLNALAAAVSLFVQLAAMNQFLLDPLATTAVVLLLIQPVRKHFRRSNAIAAQAAL
jgi:uncharacterized membrane protein (DUF2068 family)